MPEQAQRPRQRVAEHGRADVADVHRLGDVRRAEINHHRSRAPGFLEKKLPAAGRFAQRVRHHAGFQAKVEKARARNLHRLAPGADVKLGDDRGGKLARIHFARLGQGHEGVALVIAKARFEAWPNLDGRRVPHPAERRKRPAARAVGERVETREYAGAARLFLRRIFPNDVKHRLPVGGLFQLLAKFFDVQQFGDAGEGVQMFLELPPAARGTTSRG